MGHLFFVNGKEMTQKSEHVPNVTLAILLFKRIFLVCEMKKTLFITLLMVMDSAFAINTSGYVEIGEVKAWDSVIEVYLNDGQQHQCENQSHPGRFLLNPSSNHKVSVVLSAFMAGKRVSLSYLCNTEGHPEISGIRVR